MEFSDNPEKLMEWIPLIMEDRTSNEPIAATKIDSGTDVNFGALTRMLFDHLKNQDVMSITDIVLIILNVLVMAHGN